MYGGGVAEQCSAKIQLFFRAEKLEDKDTLSKSDPYLCLFDYTGQLKRGLIGKTETIQNDLNPQWKTCMTVNFYFERKQEMLATVIDDDGGKSDADNEMLMTVPFQLAQVMSARGHTLKLQSGKSLLFITAVEINQNVNDQFRLAFFGRKLAKMDTFGLSDPYFFLYRVQPNGTRKELYKSSVIGNTLDPTWGPLPLFPLNELSTANFDEKCLEFECYDEDTFSDDLIGKLKLSLNDLIDSYSNKTPLKLRRDGKDKSYGEIYAGSAEIEHQPSFAEYLSRGLQINLAVSVDFTGSNGDPRQPNSLHYMNPNSPNQYVRAIMSVGDILMQYDTDKMVPAFGFGARLPDGNISHFFHLNMEQNPYVPGVQGVLDAYGRCLTQVKLSGPTNFAPSIRAVTDGARKSEGVYTVHLILTDGEITDMPQTIDAIVAADSAPLSIVIVGVGSDCGFEMMDQLDGDEAALVDGNNTICGRDLVQFVPFRKFINAPPEALASEVLKEIPDQVCKWAHRTGYKPPFPPQQQQQ